MDTLSGIRNFFQTRDFSSLSNMNALNALNESVAPQNTGGLKYITDLLKPSL